MSAEDGCVDWDVNHNDDINKNKKDDDKKDDDKKKDDIKEWVKNMTIQIRLIIEKKKKDITLARDNNSHN